MIALAIWLVHSVLSSMYGERASTLHVGQDWAAGGRGWDTGAAASVAPGKIMVN